MRYRIGLVLALGCGLYMLGTAACAGTSPLGCDDLRTSCGDAGTTDAHGATEDTGADGNVVSGAALPGRGPPPPDAAPSRDGESDARVPACHAATYCGPAAGCVDTMSSVANCGACGHACPPATNGE